LEKRLAGCEKKNDSQDKSLGNHETRISSLEGLIKDLTSKLNAIAKQVSSMSNMPIADEPKGDIDTAAVL